jgi:excisionase family DNA binding protein
VDPHYQLLTVVEGAALLGMKRSTLYQWIYKRRIPFVKLRGGRAVRLRLSTLQTLIDEGEQRSRNTVP